MRRLRIVIEQEAMIEIDEDKLAATNEMNLSPEPMARLLEMRLFAAETSTQEIATAIGTSDDFSPKAEVDAAVYIEQQCERHPDVWFALNDRKALVGCWRCKTDERMERRGQ